MSHSSSPNNRGSIFGWVKSLKKGNGASSDSINEVLSDYENSVGDPKSASKSSLAGAQQTHNGSSPSHQEFLRPLLHHKSRSTNNVNRVRSNSLNYSDKSSSIRQHRDSFLQNNSLVDQNSKYFGVPLKRAIEQASAKISIFVSEDSNHVLQYGRIPIVVAKCGVFLKKNGLKVEGIFRVGGSSKRLKELQVHFNSPPSFGKKLNWDGYNVHDAASILRRYLNALPEPLIPLETYESFRDPLRKRPRIINYMKYKAENPKKAVQNSFKPGEYNYADTKEIADHVTVQDTPVELLDSSNSEPLTETNIGRLNNNSSSKATDRLQGDSAIKQEPPIEKSAYKDFQGFTKKSRNYKKLTRDVRDAIDEYKSMVDDLPDLSKQLLFYILDLLAMVQNHSDENLMSSRNLAAIFQPSILSHPDHDLDPVEYALSQSVVEFLIQYAYKLLPNQNNASKNDSSCSEKETNINSGSESDNTARSKSSELLTQPVVLQRKHSKSLSSSPNHDVVGYKHKTSSKAAPIIDTDNDFEITDDETDMLYSENDETNMKNLTIDETEDVNLKETPQEESTSKLNDQVNDESKPEVAIIISTPSTVSVTDAT